MKILIATQYLSIVGGVETYLRTLTSSLISRGHDIGILYEHTVENGKPTILDHTEGLFRTHSFLEAMAWKPDICFQNGLSSVDLENRILKEVPTILFAHNYQGLCISGKKRCNNEPCTSPLSASCLIRYLPLRCGGLNPITMLSLYKRNRSRQSNLAAYRMVLVASQAMSNELLRNGVPSQQIQIVPLFPTDIKPDPNEPLPRERSDRLLFMGRITEEKGWKHLVPAVLSASSQLGRKLTLAIAGDGPDREQFRKVAKRSSLSVEFLGWLQHADRTFQMRQADVLLFPSLWPEPFGLSGIEAGCVGLPAVGYMVGGVTEWLHGGYSGEIASGLRPCPKAFASGIVRSIHDIAHWQKLRVGAWKTSLQFSQNYHVAQLCHLFEKIVA